MDLARDEIQLIDDAERALTTSRARHIVLFALLLVFVAGLFLELVSPNMVAIACVAISVCAVLIPQLSAPSYTKMVKLLVRLRSESSHPEIDPVIDALSKD